MARDEKAVVELNSATTTVHRHRTAIWRSRLSIGAGAALADGLLHDRSTLDFGAGRGHDAQNLTRLGVAVDAYDPHFFPDTRLLYSHDVVLLTYVLNAIEHQEQRREAAASAWGLTNKVLIVTTRLSHERARVKGRAYGDGVVTSRSTFQHLFTTAELASYVADVTGVRPVVARPGLVYAFRHDSDRLSYLSRRYGLPVAPEQLRTLDDSIRFYERRGRMPAPCDGINETDLKSVRAAVRRAADKRLAEQAKRSTMLNLLLMLAMARFHGVLPFASLPAPVQTDIREMFGSYQHATWRASRLLGQLKDQTILRRTMRASVGKMTPTALYVHRRSLPQAPVLLRIYEECGALAAGRPNEWDVVKLHHDRRMISWLRYPRFDKDPHPSLLCSDYVDLSTLRPGHSDYATSSNPPVLHRKEEFLAPEDPRALMYARLTAAEARAGLYDNPQLIGTRTGWEAELLRCGKLLRGHRLANISTPGTA